MLLLQPGNIRTYSRIVRDAFYQLREKVSGALTGERAKSIILIFALFLICGAFFSDILNIGNLFTERDLGVYFIPPHYFWVAAVKAGEFPLWNALNFGGHPFFATLQPGMLYPPNILFFVLPFNSAFNWIIIIHFFLAGAFTFAFLRFLAVGRGASFLGAVLFLLGGYLLSLHNLLSALLSVAWLPLILLLFGKALRFNSAGSAAWAGVILAVSFYGGGVETVLGTCAALGLMAVFSRDLGGSILFGVKALVITGTVFLGVAAIQIIPFLELARYSIRKDGLSYQQAIIWSASPADFISFLVPDPYGTLSDPKKYWIRQSWLKTLYVGGLPFLLSAIYIVREKRTKYFWLALCAISIFLALGGFNPLYPYLYKFVPVLNKVRYPVKFLFLGMFALCIMAGLGLQHLVNAAKKCDETRLKWIAIILATAMALFFLWLNVQNDQVLSFMKASGLDSPIYNDAAVNLHNFKRMLFYLVLSCVGLWLIIETKGSHYAVGALCLVLILDLFGNFGYYHSSNPRIYWADNWTVRQTKAGLGEYRVLTTPLTTAPTSTFTAPNIMPGGSNQRILMPSLNLNYGIRDMWGAEVMRVGRSDDLYNTMAASVSVDSTRILDFYSDKYVISTKLISSPHFDLVGADIEGLKGDRNALLQEPTIKLYRNKRVLPRTFLVPEYWVAADSATALALVSKGDFKPEKNVVLEEKPIWDPKISSTTLPAGPADSRILHESNNAVEVMARVARPTLLYLSDTYFPGWNAYVDGKKTKIYRANYNFRAVPLPPGEHRVEFRYEPISFYAGAGITGITLVILIAFGIKSLVTRRRRSRSTIDCTIITA